jgi:hypothetical protein
MWLVTRFLPTPSLSSCRRTARAILPFSAELQCALCIVHCDAGGVLWCVDCIDIASQFDTCVDTGVSSGLPYGIALKVPTGGPLCSRLVDARIWAWLITERAGSMKRYELLLCANEGKGRSPCIRGCRGRALDAAKVLFRPDTSVWGLPASVAESVTVQHVRVDIGVTSDFPYGMAWKFPTVGALV